MGSFCAGVLSTIMWWYKNESVSSVLTRVRFRDSMSHGGGSTGRQVSLCHGGVLVGHQHPTVGQGATPWGVTPWDKGHQHPPVGGQGGAVVCMGV